MKRSSGILLPVFSLPSRHGIGTFGEEAYKFIDFLTSAGQKYWQMLPLGPTGFGDSPYQSFSTYAGNPYFIDLCLLVKAGLLSQEEVDDVNWGDAPTRVDYGVLYLKRDSILKKAFFRFQNLAHEELKIQYLNEQSSTGQDTGGPGLINWDFIDINSPSQNLASSDFTSNKFNRFCVENGQWLDDYSLFMALKYHFNMRPWYEWQDEGIRRYNPESIAEYREKLREDIIYHCFVQYLFFSQWDALCDYGHKKGISFIGDLPIYVSMDSADAWSSAHVLQFDKEGRPLAVGGVPPDYFSETGQLWGNPLYDWDQMQKDDYIWWMKRINAVARMFDCVRLDHFRGFYDYWSIPEGEAAAVIGQWEAGPGIDFIIKMKSTFPGLDVIAEDLGTLTPSVYKFVQDSGFPGMKVLQFAFGSGNTSDYLPHRYSANSVVYIGTHDNTTIRGWLEEEATLHEKNYAEEYLGLSTKEGWNWGFIRGAMRSVANLCIVQMQDYLDLPGSERINKPGTLGGNWQWRLKNGELTEELSSRIWKMTQTYER